MGWTSIPVSILGNRFAGTVLTTEDGGVSWQHQPSHTIYGLSAITCPSAAACLAVGWDGTIMSSSRSGTPSGPHFGELRRGYRLASSAHGTSEDLYGIVCPTSARCIAVGDGGTILTGADGGVHWSRRSSGVFARLLTIACSSSETCTTSGEGGALLESADGGATWASRTLGMDSLAVRHHL